MQFVQKILFFLFLPSTSIAQSNLVVHRSNKIQFTDQLPRTAACMQIQAIAVLPANGGEVDARGALGFFTCSARLQQFLGTSPHRNIHAIGPTGRSSLHRWSLVDHDALHFVLGRRVCVAGSRYRQNNPCSILPKLSFMTAEERKQIQG